MPIDYLVDHERRLVMAKAYGTLTDEDVFGYQRKLWSRPDVQGYSELVDMTDVEHIVPPSADRVNQLAKLAAGMDAPAVQSRFAILAPSDFAFGLGRMFASYRRIDERSTKQVGVFRSMDEALAFLGINDPSGSGS